MFRLKRRFVQPGNLILLVGQSNVLSAGYIDQFEGTGNALDLLRPSVLREYQRVFIWSPSQNKFVKLQARISNLGYQNNTIGPEIGVAQRWEQENPTGNLYIVKQSIPGVPITTWDDGQQGWSELSTWTDGAIAALKAAGLVPHIIGWWWNQGETGGNDPAYDSKLQNLADRMRARGFLTADTQAVIALMRYDSVMRQQEMQFVARNSPWASYVETVGYGVNSDNLHFTAATQFLSGHTDIYNKVFKLTSSYPFPM
jgi:hypothetical protein